MKVEDYEYLWKGPDAVGALIALPQLPGEAGPQYAIANRRARALVLIEDDAIAEAVKEQLRRHGVPILPPDEL